MEMLPPKLQYDRASRGACRALRSLAADPRASA
jgi:hypothetical protein